MVRKCEHVAPRIEQPDDELGGQVVRAEQVQVRPSALAPRHHQREPVMLDAFRNLGVVEVQPVTTFPVVIDVDAAE